MFRTRPLHLLVGTVVAIILLTGSVGTATASRSSVHARFSSSLSRAQLALQVRELNSELRTARARGMTLTPLAHRYFSASFGKKLAMIQSLQPDGRSGVVTLATSSHASAGSPTAPDGFVGPGPQQFFFPCWCGYGVRANVYFFVNLGTSYVEWHDINLVGGNREQNGPVAFCDVDQCLMWAFHYPGYNWHAADGWAFSSDGAWYDFSSCG